MMSFIKHALSRLKSIGENGMQPPTVPGGDEGQADADQEYSGPESA